MKLLACRILLVVCLLGLFGGNLFGAGVTLVTHGYQTTTSPQFPAWSKAMSDAIGTRIGASRYSIYRYTVTADLLHLYDGISGPVIVNPTLPDSGEILIEVDWSEVAGGGGLEAQTPEIAQQLATRLVDPYYFPSLGRAPCELPVHFIGHSRGGALVVQLADYLRLYGIWVNHVTALDPHPELIDGGSGNVNLHENVLFADDYYHDNWGVNMDLSGMSIGGAYLRYLGYTTDLPGGYPHAHSDVHLWYHGTINTNTQCYDNETDAPDGITSSMRASVTWWKSEENRGAKAGFYYSRLQGGTIKGGTRTYNGASAGLYSPPAYQPERQPWSITTGDASLWDNVELSDAESDRTFVQGSNVTVTATFLDFNGDAWIEFGVDTDRNPFNGKYQSLASYNTSAGATQQQVSQQLATDGIPTNTYYVYARIYNGQHSRYFYGNGRITLTAANRTIRLTGDLAFGNVSVGSSAQRTLVIYNDGNSPLIVTSISYPAGFSGNWSRGTIAANSSTSVSVTFTPTAVQSFGGTLTVTSDKTGGTATFSCSGSGVTSSRLTISRPAANPYVTAETSFQVQGVAEGGASSVTWQNMNSGDSGTANWSVSGGGQWYFNVSLQNGDNNLVVTAHYSDGTSVSSSVLIRRSDSVKTTSFPSESVTVYSGNQHTTVGPPVYCGYDPAGGTYSVYNQRGLIRFTGLSLPVGSTIQTAQMRCNSKKAMSNGDTTLAINCCRLTTSWTASKFGASWSTSDNYTTTYGSSQDIRKDIDDVKFFDVTEITKLWFNGTANNGVVLISSKESCGYWNDRYLEGFRLDVTYTTETTPPTVAIVSPASTSTYTTRALSINLAGTASDTQNTISTVTWRNDLTGQGGTCSGTSAWSISNIALLEGVNRITIIAVDAAGNPASAAIDVTCNPPRRILRLEGQLTFGEVIVGSTTNANITLYNDGDSPLTVTNISCPGSFAANWSGVITQGQAQTATVTFSPASVQTYSGSVSVNSDKTTGENTLTCSGIGIAATRIIRLDGTLSFGDVVTNLERSLILTIYNDGNSSLVVSNIVYPSYWTGAWQGSIPAGGWQDVQVTFKPKAITTYSGTISVQANQTSGSAIILSSGNGVAPRRVLTVSGALDFGDVGLGRSATNSITVLNSGNVPVSLAAVTCPDGFFVDTTNMVLSVNEIRRINSWFTPASPKAYSGSILLHSDATNNPAAVLCLGNGKWPAAVAWGSGVYAQVPVPLGLSNLVSVAAGTYHSLALRADGTVSAWGSNTYRQVSVPAGLSNVVSVAAGTYHSLALRADGTVSAWGSNTYGQVSVPAGLSNVVSVAAGTYHSLALRADGTVSAWGSNTYGQVSVPAGLNNVVSVAAGTYHSLALRADGTVAAWGSNTNGQLSIPLWLSNVVAVAASSHASMAVVGSGKPFASPSVRQIMVHGGGQGFLRVIAAGMLPLEYNWQKDGVPLVGASKAVVPLIVTNASQLGTYRCTVSNVYGGAVGTDVRVVAIGDRYSLIVSMPSYGSGVPSYGTQSVIRGFSIQAMVTNSPSVMGSTTQFVCRGWTGTGSVPASGTTTNTGYFVVTNNSSLAWLWKTQYIFGVTSGSNGSVVTTNGWFDRGSNAVAKAQADSHYHFAGWTGQTNGCSIISNVITAPMTQSRAISARFAIDRLRLSVTTPHGKASPSGTTTNDWGSLITATLSNSPVLNGTTQYVCRGWSGSGSVPVAGLGTNTGPFTLMTNSSITWLWTTNFWLDTVTNGSGGVDIPDQWCGKGTNLVVTATPAAFNRFTGWSGLTNGCTISSNQITVVMDRARAITAKFVRQYSLTMATPYGQGTPSAGTNWYDTGLSITTRLTNSPVIVGATQYVCRGWSGTGSVPASGATTNAGPFTITTNSTLTWLWRTNYWLDVGSTGKGSLNSSDRWLPLGTNLLVSATPSNHWHFTQWSGDTNGCTLVSNKITVLMNNPRSVVASFVIDQHRVVVTSPYGQANPPAGTNWFDYGSSNRFVVTNSPVIMGATQYVCRGWSGTGSVPASGTATNTAVFVLTTNSVITWKWSTNYWLHLDKKGGGALNTNDTWFALGSNAVVIATPTNYFTFGHWEGQTNGCTVASNKITVVMNSPRTVMAVFNAALATNNVPKWWLAQCGLTNFNADAMQDVDHDGMLTWQEWVAGCNPTDSNSVFRFTGSQSAPSGQGMVVRWPSISNRFYDLSRATNLLGGTNAFITLPGASNMPALPAENCYTDTVQGVGPYFYKIDVHE